MIVWMSMTPQTYLDRPWTFARLSTVISLASNTSKQHHRQNSSSRFYSASRDLKHCLWVPASLLSRYPLKILQLPPYFPESCPCQQTLLCSYSTDGSPAFSSHDTMSYRLCQPSHPHTGFIDCSHSGLTVECEFTCRPRPEETQQSSECAKIPRNAMRESSVWGETSRLKTSQKRSIIHVNTIGMH